MDERVNLPVGLKPISEIKTVSSLPSEITCINYEDYLKQTTDTVGTDQYIITNYSKYLDLLKNQKNDELYHWNITRNIRYEATLKSLLNNSNIIEKMKRDNQLFNVRMALVRFMSRNDPDRTGLFTFSELKKFKMIDYVLYLLPYAKGKSVLNDKTIKELIKETENVERLKNEELSMENLVLFLRLSRTNKITDFLDNIPVDDRIDLLIRLLKYNYIVNGHMLNANYNIRKNFNDNLKPVYWTTDDKSNLVDGEIQSLINIVKDEVLVYLYDNTAVISNKQWDETTIKYLNGFMPKVNDKYVEREELTLKKANELIKLIPEERLKTLREEVKTAIKRYITTATSANLSHIMLIPSIDPQKELNHELAIPTLDNPVYKKLFIKVLSLYEKQNKEYPDYMMYDEIAEFTNLDIVEKARLRTILRNVAETYIKNAKYNRMIHMYDVDIVPEKNSVTLTPSSVMTLSSIDTTKSLKDQKPKENASIIAVKPKETVTTATWSTLSDLIGLTKSHLDVIANELVIDLYELIQSIPTISTTETLDKTINNKSWYNGDNNFKNDTNLNKVLLPNRELNRKDFYEALDVIKPEAKDSFTEFGRKLLDDLGMIGFNDTYGFDTYSGVVVKNNDDIPVPEGVTVDPWVATVINRSLGKNTKNILSGITTTWNTIVHQGDQVREETKAELIDLGLKMGVSPADVIDRYSGTFTNWHKTEMSYGLDLQYIYDTKHGNKYTKEPDRKIKYFNNFDDSIGLLDIQMGNLKIPNLKYLNLESMRAKYDQYQRKARRITESAEDRLWKMQMKTIAGFALGNKINDVDYYNKIRNGYKTEVANGLTGVIKSAAKQTQVYKTYNAAYNAFDEGLETVTNFVDESVSILDDGIDAVTDIAQAGLDEIKDLYQSVSPLVSAAANLADKLKGGFFKDSAKTNFTKDSSLMSLFGKGSSEKPKNYDESFLKSSITSIKIDGKELQGYKFKDYYEELDFINGKVAKRILNLTVTEGSISIWKNFPSKGKPIVITRSFTFDQQDRKMMDKLDPDKPVSGLYQWHTLDQIEHVYVAKLLNRSALPKEPKKQKTQTDLHKVKDGAKYYNITLEIIPIIASKSTNTDTYDKPYISYMALDTKSKKMDESSENSFTNAFGLKLPSGIDSMIKTKVTDVVNKFSEATGLNNIDFKKVAQAVGAGVHLYNEGKKFYDTTIKPRVSGESPFAKRLEKNFNKLEGLGSRLNDNAKNTGDRLFNIGNKFTEEVFPKDTYQIDDNLNHHRECTKIATTKTYSPIIVNDLNKAQIGFIGSVPRTITGSRIDEDYQIRGIEVF